MSTEAKKAIVVLGRGIFEKQPGVFVPTSYLETPAGDGFSHTGFPSPNADFKDGNSVIAGSENNALAAARLYAKNPEAAIVWAAGRPKYLAERVSDISEGRVMHETFLGELTRLGTPNPKSVTFLEDHRNTRDDARGAIEYGVREGIREITIITVSVHLDRTIGFILDELKNNLAAKRITFNFLASEELAPPNVNDLVATAAFGKSYDNERRGYQAAFVDNNYKSAQDQAA